MKPWHKPFQALAALIILTCLIGASAMNPGGTPGRVHPLLAAMAARESGKVIRVIVQKTDAAVQDTVQLEEEVVRLGGKITQDLYIIHAFSAEMTAGAALRLASLPGVRWVSPDAAATRSGEPSTKAGEQRDDLDSYFLDTLGVRQVWEMGVKGQGIGVAVVDSGIANGADFLNQPNPSENSRILVQMSFNPGKTSSKDELGHGTHVAGIIGGNGATSRGRYSGIAPMVNLISLKVCDKDGSAYESDVVAALQWIYEHKSEYNIRVVNLSLNSTLEQSYLTSPLDAAVEILWFNKLVVVVSSGKQTSGASGSTINTAPANDPFVISVGASSENGTPDPTDDAVAGFSPYGHTLDGFAKPDIIAPGQDIASVMAGNSPWISSHPERLLLNGRYIRLSGTSMSAAMVSGAAALLLQHEPSLTPDQVKFRLLDAANEVYDENGNAFPYLNVFATVTGVSDGSANTGQTASHLLWTGDEPVSWDSVSWNSVSWNSVSWNSVSWNSVSWNSVSWNSVFWGP